ncbi:4Fe-4S binding protein [Sideroxydans lithotrophicus]|uniref:Polyferredoxin-like protein n=1 Tax=Sideroxydans lithotrophicus (strain ES-1) TaxID=580332 RepID=D5CT17_SIDLE|nr:4Fe-4S binding protein [Sideroxydans lithotrophicus]ADE12103.1 Polyferredoxin-like protein [Sideroxydans lithotrophicus ES-1]
MTSAQYRWKRRAVQLGTLLLIALIPALGLFRIDLTTASFTILDSQIWWSNFSFVFGLAILLVTVPIIIYMTLGTAWCGWACPQNLLSEWANNLTYKLLGKRASVAVDGEGLKVAASKNKISNWVILTAAFLGVSMILALVPFLFFFSLAEVWSFFSPSSSAQLSAFMQRLYYFAVFLIFIDIAVVRYFMCDYACLYRIGQKMFKTQDALHVNYDASRSDECSKCNYCAASCVTSIEPTEIKIFDSCINCGECIDACNRLHDKSGTKGLLSFEFGNKASSSSWSEKIGMIFSRFNWLVGGFFVMGVAMMMWGIYTQQQIPAQVPIEQQLRERQLANACNSQCETQQSLCKVGNMAECYRAAACKCECFLQHDPGNASSGQWRQCVQQNMANAESRTGKDRRSTLDRSIP